jgi:hypothetical protein
MKLSAYLSPSRHGVFYFRWPLPSPNRQSRRTVRLSLRTKCPDRAGDLARYLASCGRLVRDDKTLTRLKQNEIRQKVTDYFKAQLDRYLDWLDKRVLSKNALADAREEMLDHDCMVDLGSVHPQYLPIARFKRRMNVSDAAWDASLPQIAIELRKGRRDMLKDVLSAAEGLESYSFKEPACAATGPLRGAERRHSRFQSRARSAMVSGDAEQGGCIPCGAGGVFRARSANGPNNPARRR